MDPFLRGWEGLGKLEEGAALRPLCLVLLPHPTPCREGVEKMLGDLSVSPQELAFGKTKIFIRSPKTVSWRV